MVIGGAEFIGGNFVIDRVAGYDEPVINLDKLTCARNLQTLATLHGNPRHTFVQGCTATVLGRAPANRASAACSYQLCGRESCGPIHPWPG
jgi:dTDP-D-glucose 4,6-dehydratase